ncbi:hypothetical protein ES706_05400 [subsurface metagenome]
MEKNKGNSSREKKIFIILKDFFTDLKELLIRNKGSFGRIFLYSLVTIIATLPLRSDFEFVTNAVQDVWARYYEVSSVYRARIIGHEIFRFMVFYPSVSWYVLRVIFGINAELLRRYLKLKRLKGKYIEIAAFSYLFSPVIFWSGTTHSRTGFYQIDAVMFLLLLISLLLLEKNEKASLLFQLFTILVKEHIALLVFAWYFLQGNQKIRDILRGIKLSKIWIPLITAGTYLMIRLYYREILPKTYHSNPFDAGTIYQLYMMCIGERYTPFMKNQPFWRIFLSLNIFWLFLIPLCRRQNRDILYLFLINLMFILTFAYIWETNKLFIMFPWVFLLFFNFFQERKKKALTSDNSQQKSVSDDFKKNKKSSRIG